MTRMFWAAMKMIMGLGAVLGVLYLLVGLARRSGMGLREPQADSWIRLIATQPIAPRKSISLIAVGREVLVVGITESQITLLDKVTDPDRASRILEMAPGRITPFHWMDRWLPGLRRRPEVEQVFHEK
jgi:flagellar biosynthetic protein FliO